MKSAIHLNSFALNSNQLKNTKGGNNNTVTVETIVEITTVDSTTGATEMLFCDRRRKRVNC